jgi:MFS family permease
VPAIGQLAKDLNTSAQNMTWTLTAYLVSAAALTPVLGRLGDMFGKRRMLVISLLVFAAGGALAALGGNPGQVVTGRVLQGAGGGIFPLCFGIVRDEFPAKRRPGAVGPVSAIAGIGGGFGLLMGGLLVDHASYHWIFWSGAFDDRLLVDALAQGVISAPGFSPDTTGRIADMMERAKADGKIRADATLQDLTVLLGGCATQPARLGEHDPAAWRRYGGIVMNALRP